MKKLLSVFALFLLATPAMAINFGGGHPNSHYESAADMFATGVNSGLAITTIPGDFLSLGFQANIAINPEEGILSQAGNTDNYFFPNLFLNFRIDDFLIFVRGMYMNQGECI